MSTITSNSVSSFSESSNSVGRNAGLRNLAELTGRGLLVTLFLISGIGKLSAYAGTAAYMASMGVPGAALPFVIGLEILGSIAIILGWNTRVVSVILAGFTLATGVLFHNNFADQMQMIMFLKNLSITGAFIMLAVNGAGKFSVDQQLKK